MGRATKGRITPKGTNARTQPAYRHRPAASADRALFPRDMAETRAALDRLSDAVEDWQGIPVPLGEDTRVIVHDRHPLRDFYASLYGPDVEVIVDPTPRPEDEPFTGVDSLERLIADRVAHEQVRNQWYSAKLHATVYVMERRDTGRRFAVKVPEAPDGCMDRMTYWLTTLGASDAWDLDAEHKAREKLRGMLSERQWRHYDLTGTFLETSERSRLTYVFRRSRPTLALTPRWPWWRQRDNMKCLAVLCTHPIGYYGKSWAGCMVPSDDVIAHLTMMRADEAYFWRVANQHQPWRPEAGL